MDLGVALRNARQLLKAGSADDAVEAIQRGLRAGVATPGELDRAGRLLQRALPASEIAVAAEVHLVGQVTTAWLGTTLTAVAWRADMALTVVDAEFDNVVQHIASLPLESSVPRVVVLVPWLRRVDGARSQSVDAALRLWQMAWSLCAERGIRVVQVGYDAPLPGASGFHLAAVASSPVATAARLNASLREALPAGAAFFDLSLVAGDLGRRHTYEARGEHLARQPFAPEGTAWIARHLHALLRATLTGPKKVLVLDLDNTLWGGVVGDEGPLGVELGESPEGQAFVAFQRACKALADRGVVLAVASKNNDADAREPFEQHPDMVLQLDDLAAFEAHWEPKSVSLQRISEQLRLSLEHMVFFDDNPAERAQVRQALPMVEVVEVPEDPAEYVRALAEGLYFEATAITEADRQRAVQYQQERKRRDVAAATPSLDDYLTGLDMVGDVRALDDADMARVSQLVGKTNQWNLTTRRHAREVIEAMAAQDRSVCLTFRLADTFGDYGLVGAILAVPDPADDTVLDIDTWLMSCRVIGRTAERFFFAALVRAAQGLGYRRLRGTWLRTKKNALVEPLFGELGGTAVLDEADRKVWTFDLPGLAPPASFIEPVA